MRSNTSFSTLAFLLALVCLASWVKAASIKDDRILDKRFADDTLKIVERSAEEVEEEGNIDSEEVEDRKKRSDEPEDSSQPIEDRKKRAVAEFEKGSEKLWPIDKPIQYKIDKSMKNEKALLDLLKESTEYISKRTCLTFKEIKQGSGDYLEIMNAKKGRCVSFYGKQGGAQQLMLTDDSSEGCGSLAMVSHELFHALGLAHEMQRKDRNKYITVNKQNLANEKQFKIDDKLNILSREPDLPSVMTYDKKYLQKNKGKDTMEAKDDDMEFYLRRIVKTYAKPSFHDIKGINDLYGCSDKCKNKDCHNGGYKAGLGCKCQCPDGFTGNDCEKRENTECGAEYTKKSGSIKTKSFTNDLFSTKMVEKTCSYLIDSKKDEVVLVSFHSNFYTEDMDQGVNNYVEVRSEGTRYSGHRLYGSKDLTNMAYEMKGPGAYIEMGIKSTNGYGVGFQANYQVLKESDHKRCHASKSPTICYNGGTLEVGGSCKCSCLPGYTGNDCSQFEDKKCKANFPCENGGILQVGKKGCACKCPESDKMAAPITGNKCQYFGACYLRAPAPGNKLLSMVGIKTLKEDGICSQMKQCDGKLSTMAKCPVLCDTKCECADTEKCSAMKPKGKDAICGKAGVLCELFCDAC